MAELGQHAVVLGASMGGLLATRVLADVYPTVTVVERDVLPADPVSRRGVPQGRQIHALQARGSQILDELFPGLLEELVASGVANWDGDFSKLFVSVGGHRLLRSGRSPDPQSVSICFPSRPLLEWHVRRRVREIPNVMILEGHDVVGLTSTPDRDSVTGARVVNRDGGSEATLTADLVVDATGRGSRTPIFLEELGYSRPPEDELMVHLAYACQPLRIAPGAVGEHMLAIFPEPGRPKMFGLIGYENDTWMFAVGAMAGLEPPRKRADMLAFAADFAPPHALAAVSAAEPLGEVAHYRVPSNRWRRYDKMRRTPEGLLVFGDGICSFNPIYGQGMTIAALEALVLRDCLRRGARNLPRRFFRASAKKVRVAWQTAVGSDLALPEVVGPRPLSMRISNGYLGRVMAAAETDRVAAQQFIRLIGMIDSPVRVLRPSFMLRVARANRRRRIDARRPDDLADSLSAGSGPSMNAGVRSRDVVIDGVRSPVWKAGPPDSAGAHRRCQRLETAVPAREPPSPSHFRAT
jgi:2-polyprenyl-6-methoxyphenol hydroxylase-like FAD-dependent oxidoreductase